MFAPMANTAAFSVTDPWVVDGAVTVVVVTFCTARSNLPSDTEPKCAALPVYVALYLSIPNSEGLTVHDPRPAITVAVHVYPGRGVGTTGARATVPVAAGVPASEVTVTLKVYVSPTLMMPGLGLVIFVVVPERLTDSRVAPTDPACVRSPE